MKIWLIAGAFSGVGKTTLAESLAATLPGAVTVKVGHCKRKKKIDNVYFTSGDAAIDFIENHSGEFEHIVVESQRLVGSISADIVIFLDSMEGDRRPDAKKLRSAANIILGHNGNPSQWKKSISDLELDKCTRNEVLDILHDQHEFLSGNRLSLRTKIWFASGGKVVFGEGLARLLYGVECEGSLSAAARKEEISYRHAWGDIKKAEERLGFELIERQIGGKDGGGASLTDKAKRLLKGYETLKRKSVRESDKWFRKLMEEMDIT